MSQKVDFKPRYTNWIKEGIFMIIMRCTLNKDILDNMILHAPTKGEVVDSKEDLSIIANYIESLNMEQAKTR